MPATSKAERLARRDLDKPDAFAEAVTPLLERLEANWRVVALVAGGVLVAAVAIIAGLTLSSHHDEAAAAVMGDALRQTEKQVIDEKAADAKADAKDKTDYFATEQQKQQAIAKAAEDVVKKEGGTVSARTALLTLGDADYRLGKYADALDAYGKFLDQAPATDPLRAFALQGQAYALLAAGKGDEAIAAARKLVDGAPGGFGRDLGLLAEGRIAEQTGKLDIAKDAYQKLSVDYPSTAAGRAASDRLGMLGFAPDSPAAKPATVP